MAKVHIKLSTIKCQLQQRMHYPTEHIFSDDDFLTLDEAFDELLEGFYKHRAPNIQNAYSQLHKTRKQGWMTERVADEFTDYCITGWKIV